MISDEAVQAAVKAWRETPIGGDALMNALEAAAPYIAADAWHRGYVSALHNMEFYGATTNPYRSQA